MDCCVGIDACAWLPGPMLTAREATHAAEELAGKSGAHLEDCGVVEPQRRGKDDAMAAALWQETNRQLDAALLQDSKPVG